MIQYNFGAVALRQLYFSFYFSHSNLNAFALLQNYQFMISESTVASRYLYEQATEG